MTENAKERITLLNEKAQRLFLELRDLKVQLEDLEKESLSTSEDVLAAVQAIRDELGVSPEDAIRVSTWPISGPGSAKCMHCTAGGGA
jgi:predicted nuclease with TOPRIM domain